MNILINAAGRMIGGAIAVADSICSYLYKFPQHSFTVVLADECKHIGPKIEPLDNVEVVYYNIGINVKLILTSREKFMDTLVAEKKIDGVFTVFASYWKPRCPHLSGFARPLIVYRDSPYFKTLGIADRFKQDVINLIQLHCYRRTSRHIYTENPDVTARLQRMMPKNKVYTISSYYHQVYDQPEKWQLKKLPPFDGTSMLTIAAPYGTKNLPITVEVAKILRKEHPDFKFRFVLTLKEEELIGYDASLKENFVFIGRVKIEECPTLYVQTDIMFMPTLLECFSATYAEAMRMERAIVTTNLGFVTGVCGDAALYYSPLSAKEAANAIYKAATDDKLYKSLTGKGLMQLQKFYNSEERAQRSISLMEKIIKDEQ